MKIESVDHTSSRHYILGAQSAEALQAALIRYLGSDTARARTPAAFRSDLVALAEGPITVEPRIGRFQLELATDDTVSLTCWLAVYPGGRRGLRASALYTESGEWRILDLEEVHSAARR